MTAKREECEACGYETELSLFPDWHTEHGREDVWLCEVCANTHLGKVRTYPSQVPDTQLYRSIAILGNMILDAIKEQKRY